MSDIPREPHLLHFEMDGYFQLTVSEIDCPYEELGIDRPCALWETEDGSRKSDACSLQHWFHASGGCAEELGFRLPEKTYWIEAESPLAVDHSFVSDSLEMWPWGLR